VFLCYTFQPQSGGISLVMIFRGCGGTWGGGGEGGRRANDSPPKRKIEDK
jgi:hypothetical protein